MSLPRALCWILLFLLGTLGAREHPLGEPYFETVPGSADLANGIVTAVAQDRRGLLWFGTPEGLYSYDGHRLREYRQQEGQPRSLGDNYVRALLARPDGSLWVATQAAGISIYRLESDDFDALRHDPANPDSPSSDGSIALAQQADGVIWIGYGSTGLDRYDPATQRFTHFRAPQLAHDTVRALLVDRRGDLWLGGGDGLQRRRAGSDAFERVASTPGVDGSLAGHYVYALHEAADGRLWIGTQLHGAAVLDPDDLTLTRFPAGPGPDQLAHAWIDGFIEPEPGRMWLISFGAGIDVLDTAQGRIVQRLRSDPSIPGSLAMDRVLAPFLDRSGLIWLGTWGGGLQRHNPQNAQTFRVLRHSPVRPGALSHPTIHSLLEIAPDVLWLGTGGNGIDVLDLRRGVTGGHRPDPQRTGALRDGTVRALAKLGGDRWVGTQNGLYRWRATAEDFELLRPGLRVRCMLASRRGTLLIGLQDGALEFDPARGTWVALALAAEQPFGDAVWSLAEDPDGGLWLGTPNGLLWRPQGEQALRPVAVPGIRAVMDLKFDAVGSLWVAGPAAIAVYNDRFQSVAADERASTLERNVDPPRFTAYQRLDAIEAGLFGRQLLFDAEGRLWSPRQRIDRVSGRVDDFGLADGVAPDSVQVGASLALADGRLLFGGARGLLIVDPSRYRPWRFDPPLLLTGASIDGQALTRSQLTPGLTLRPDQSRLSVEFAALDYSAPELVQYEYRLAGLDADWNAAELGGRVATYNNLWPGEYQLQIRARGRSGVVSSAPLEVGVRVQPHWWQTAVGPLLVLALLVVLIQWISGWRSRQLQRREQRLRALVEQRTAELSQAKERAEAALGELQGTQAQLVAAEKMASLGQLVAGVAHEINTPIGIALTAASHLEDLSRSQRSQLDAGRLSKQALAQWQKQSIEAMRLVCSSLERAAELVASFKQVSVDQASQQRRAFDLAQFLGEISTALQPGLKHRPCLLAVECPAGLQMDTYPGAIFQIVTNLVNNAVLHAYPEGRRGHLRLSARPIEPPAAAKAAGAAPTAAAEVGTLSGGWVELCFRDDGVGMSPAVAARAFDPFFTTRRGQGGSGLGLHVVHNLVAQLLGGQIELSSVEGAGTTIVLRFPMRTPSGD
jgi:signal transduction histidine kinase/ligand-binding sensor domain-containing protein